MPGDPPRSQNGWSSCSWLRIRWRRQTEWKKLSADKAARDRRFRIDGKLGKIVEESADCLTRIFLLLDDKLTEIARTLGKIDSEGNIAEDLRSQILGQLSERLNYDRLYQEALSDPELKRTAVELEAALSNAREAREVIFDLFQDLDGSAWMITSHLRMSHRA